MTGCALGGTALALASRRCGRGDPPGTIWLLIPLGDARSPYDRAEPRRCVTRRGSTVNPHAAFSTSRVQHRRGWQSQRPLGERLVGGDGVAYVLTRVAECRVDPILDRLDGVGLP